MASPKKPKKRVEPRFDDAPKRKRSGGLSATDDDRAAPPRKKTANARLSTSLPSSTGAGTPTAAATRGDALLRE